MLKQVALAIIGISVLVGTIAGCVLVTSPRATITPVSTASILPTTETVTPIVLTPSPITTLDVRTPAPNTVEVILSLAEDSSEASFSVRDAAGVLVFQTYWPLERKYTLYLPPGEYTWSASAPVPTAPLGCFNVENYYGFWKDGRFVAEKDRIEIQVRLGETIVFCTPTPEN